MFLSLPGGVFHEFHHSHNAGNYGQFFTLWDWLFGTDKAFNEYVSRKKTKLNGGVGREEKEGQKEGKKQE